MSSLCSCTVRINRLFWLFDTSDTSDTSGPDVSNVFASTYVRPRSSDELLIALEDKQQKHPNLEEKFEAKLYDIFFSKVVLPCS
jgi:hypothetical protein